MDDAQVLALPTALVVGNGGGAAELDPLRLGVGTVPGDVQVYRLVVGRTRLALHRVGRHALAAREGFAVEVRDGATARPGPEPQ